MVNIFKQKGFQYITIIFLDLKYWLEIGWKAFVPIFLNSSLLTIIHPIYSSYITKYLESFIGKSDCLEGDFIGCVLTVYDSARGIDSNFIWRHLTFPAYQDMHLSRLQIPKDENISDNAKSMSIWEKETTGNHIYNCYSVTCIL